MNVPSSASLYMKTVELNSRMGTICPKLIAFSSPSIEDAGMDLSKEDAPDTTNEPEYVQKIGRCTGAQNFTGKKCSNE